MTELIVCRPLLREAEAVFRSEGSLIRGGVGPISSQPARSCSIVSSQ
jgi:hypothetical protein